MHLLAIPIALLIVIVAQDTKWAAIPKSNTIPLWISMTVSIVAYLVLRSGWGRPATHADEQRALGTTSNSYYGPRRDGILTGFTLAGGIAGAMWWGATSWLMLVRGIERHTA